MCRKRGLNCCNLSWSLAGSMSPPCPHPIGEMQPDLRADLKLVRAGRDDAGVFRYMRARAEPRSGPAWLGPRLFGAAV
jgi:hypothetical protein